MTKILIVEDEMIIAADISMQLTAFGYEVTGITPRGEDAIKNIESTRPDIVLMDIELKGTLDGIQTGEHIFDHFQIPVIFLTANADDATFERAKSAKPYAFISKPFRSADLKRSIELVEERIEAVQPNILTETDPVLADRIFVKHKDKMVKVFIKDILFAQADRNYCIVHTADREYLLTLTLRAFEESLPAGDFMRVHRSFLVNLNKIDALADNQESLILGQKNVPVSRRFKEAVLKRLRLL